MSILIPYLYLMVITLPIIVICEKKFDVCLPVAFMWAVFFLYLFGFLGYIKLGFFISLLFPLLSIMFLVFKRKITKSSFKNIFTIGFAIFTFIYFVICLYHRNTLFVKFDEMGFWGPMVKEMLRLNKFYCVDASLIRAHKDYPPFISLVETLWCYLSNGYQERNLYRAITIFNLILVVPVFEKTKIEFSLKNTSKIIITTLLFILINFVCYSEFESGHGLSTVIQSIYIDSTVAMMTAYSVFLILKDDGTLFDTLAISLSLSSLLLSKQIALGFYIMCLFLYFVKKIALKCEIKKMKTPFVLLVVLPLFLNGEWSALIKRIGTSSQFALSSETIKAVIKFLFLGKGDEWRFITLQNYITAIINKPLLDKPFSLTYFEICIICLFIIIFICQISRQLSKKEMSIISVTYIFGAIGFAFLMLFMYLSGGFEGDEALELASFKRYLTTYIFFSFSIIIYMYCYFLDEKVLSSTFLGTVLVVVFALMVQDNKKYLSFDRKPYNIYANYENSELYAQIDAYINTDDKVLIISCYDSLEALHIEYSHLEYQLDIVGFGPARFADDVYSQDVTLDEWVSVYKNYDYVYLFLTDDIFYLKYWVPSQSEYLLNNRLYRVVDNTLEIVPWLPGGTE